MAKRRGNPNWGKTAGAAPAEPAKPTSFSQVCAKHGVDEALAATSPEVSRWVRKHACSHFVPERVLKALDITVKEEF